MNKEKTYEEGFKDGVESKAVPMGVSEWRKMGKECGYTSYFEPKEKIAIYEELIDWAEKVAEYMVLDSGADIQLIKLTNILSHLKGRIEELKDENE